MTIASTLKALGLVLALAPAAAAAAQGIICRQDERSVDGPLREFRLLPEADGYRAVYVHGEPGPWGSTETEIWASRLTCRMQPPLAYCTNGTTVLSLDLSQTTRLTSVNPAVPAKVRGAVHVTLQESAVPDGGAAVPLDGPLLRFPLSECHLQD
ncbi:MAG TPA: hypothetical protein VFH51_17325 [Myxococcota bacterium]|nr:hypothetical protein [Myxococcota bacterium]